MQTAHGPAWADPSRFARRVEAISRITAGWTGFFVQTVLCQMNADRPEGDLTIGLIDGRAGAPDMPVWLHLARIRADGPQIAVVQAAGPDYAAALSAALAYPDDQDEPGDSITISSGTLILLDACIDGEGEYSAPLLPENPGPTPTHRPRFDTRLAETGGLRLTVPPSTYCLSVRWLTEVPGTDVYFARWILRGDNQPS